MKALTHVLILVCFFSVTVFAQEEKEAFIIEKEIKHLPVISQGSTGTCWSFATTSFLESEIIRKFFPESDLSEMYFVYFTYINKARQYLMYEGNNSFSQGGQAHDVLNVIRSEGAVTQDIFEGEKTDGKYQHGKLVNELKTSVDSLNSNRKDFKVEDLKSFEAILMDKIAKVPEKVKTGKGEVTPLELVRQLKINPDDYIELSSYTHHPFYKQFVLEVRDNWAHGLYYNVPVDELMEVMVYSINQGFTVCWDGDTSEKTFTHKKGKADLPENEIGKVDQEMRQQTFLNRTTTDDHLMHLVGLSKDSAGRNCFYTKNSWGNASNDFSGYLHMTEDYVRLKTMAIMVHKDAIPAQIKKKLNL